MSFWKNVLGTLRYLNPLGGLNILSDATKSGSISDVGNKVDSFINSQIGGVTERDKSLMDYQTKERIAAQDWTAQREDTEMQRRVADMRLAGINPMMAAGGGVSSSSSGSAAPSSAPAASLSELIQLLMLGPQKKLMEAQAENLFAGAEEKRAMAPYWKQRIEESIEKVKTYSASAERDVALAALNRAKTQTEDELREYEKSLKVSLRACADAETALKQQQASETEVRKGLEAAQKAYQESLNEEEMAKKVCAKIVAETELAGSSADKAEQEKVAMELANAMVRGDFVEVCLEQLRKSGHNEANAAHIASQVMAIFKNILGMVSVGVNF